MEIFVEIGVIIIIATLFGYFARLLKQPLIPAYILAGFIIGPLFGWITNEKVIFTLSEIGIAFLLFIVGLEIDLRKLKNVGFVSTIGGTILTILLFVTGYLTAIALKFTSMESIYIGLVLAFSSTMVVVKLLSDKGELNTLHGRIILGILLLQDIVAMMMLSVLTINGFSISNIGIAVFKGILLLFIVYLLAKFVFPSLFKFAARSVELLFLVSVSILFLFALLFNQFSPIIAFVWQKILFSYTLPNFIASMLATPGFSVAIGAFVAGISMAHLPYNEEIIARIRPVRDFFATIFFVSLGMALFIFNLKPIIAAVIVIAFLVMVFQPVLTTFVISLLGYRKRTSFLTALSLAQVSEFSLIIGMQGLMLKQISEQTFSFIVMLAIITIAITSYLIEYDNQIFNRFSRYLNIFDRIGKKSELEYLPPRKKYSVLLVGYDRIGYSIFKKLKQLKRKFIVVDFNPDVIRRLIKAKIACIYGDIADSAILNRIDFKKMTTVISTVPGKIENMLLIKFTKKKNKNIVVITTALDVDDALDLYRAGADYVILPHFLGGERVSLFLEEFGDAKTVIKTKINHLKELNERKQFGHVYPKKR